MKRYHLNTSGTKAALVTRLYEWGRHCQDVLYSHVYYSSISETSNTPVVASEATSPLLLSDSDVDEDSQFDIDELNEMLEENQLDDLSLEEEDGTTISSSPHDMNDNNSIDEIITSKHPSVCNSIRSLPTTLLPSQVTELTNKPNPPPTTIRSVRSLPSSILDISKPSTPVPSSDHLSTNSPVPIPSKKSPLYQQILRETTVDSETQQKLYYIAKSIYSLSSFRKGQLWAINTLLHNHNGVYCLLFFSLH